MAEESSRKSIWFRRLPPWVMMVISILVLVSIFSLLPQVGIVREPTRRVICKVNLHSIAMGVEIYREGHDDLDPVDWGELLKDGFCSTKLLVCSSIRTEAAEGTTPADLEGHVDHVLVSGMGGDAPSRLIRAFEFPCNHKQSGTNMAYTDGSVLWVDDLSQFMQQIQQTNDHLAALRMETP